MKRIILSLMATGMAGLLVTASAQPAPEDNNANAAPPTDMPMPPADMPAPPDAATVPSTPADATPATENAPSQSKEPLVITPSQTRATEPDTAPAVFAPPVEAGTNMNDLNLNFNRAPLDLVLNYLSDAAGFIIVQDTHISSSATVTISGKHLTRDEVVDLLNSVLNKNGYAVIRDGRTLTVVDKNDAKTRQIPVKSGNNPDEIPKNAEIVTQIIPIRFVEARQLVSDLSSFVSPQATVVANEAGNSIVITDTQANIRHLAEIIRAIDNSAEAETEIRVFPLKYASPTDVATELGSVFPSSTSGSGSQTPTRFAGGPGGGGGPGGFFARMMAGGGGNSASSSANDRIRKATAVTAVADARIQAVIVTAPKNLMDEIAGVIKSLDVTSDRDQNVYVFKMNNGDPQQAAQVLQNMFQSTSSRTSSGSSQNSALQQRAQNNATQQSTSSSSSSSFGGTGGRGGTGGQF